MRLRMLSVVVVLVVVVVLAVVALLKKVHTAIQTPENLPFHDNYRKICQHETGFRITCETPHPRKADATTFTVGSSSFLLVLVVVVVVVVVVIAVVVAIVVVLVAVVVVKW